MRISRLFNTASFRIAALCALLFWMILGALLFANYSATSHALEEQISQRVQEDYDSFAEEAESEGSDAVVKEIGERSDRPTQPGAYYFVAAPDGSKVAGNLTGVPIALGWQHLPASFSGKPDHDLGHEVWGLGSKIAGGYFIFVGQDAWHVLSARHALVRTFVWSGLVAGALALLAGIFLSRSVLARIDAINVTSSAIMQGNLQRRIPVKGNSDELDRLSQQLNRLFDSNQALLESLKDVSANIAHDMRTPLTRLRAKLEAARKRNADPKASRAALEAAIGESDHLLATFSALLRIAQIESGTRKRDFKLVNLSRVAERVLGIYQAVAEDEGKSLESALAPDVACQGDEDLVFQLCVNLVENAIRHTPKGTRILIRTQAPASLEVSDNGSGIPEDQRGKVLQRFFRLERSRTTPGNGLGLSMVAAIAHLHEAKLELSDNAPGLRVRVNFHPA